MKNPEFWKKVLQAVVRIIEVIIGFLAGTEVTTFLHI